MGRDKFYDQSSNRLVYIEQAPVEEFWDAQWAATAAQTFANPPRFKNFVHITKKYLPEKAKILEGGCGLGVVMNVLDKAGFDVFGIDFAPKVVESVKNNLSHLNIEVGDVRSLVYGDNEFDGYWSLGVIEHFPNGFEDIAQEMFRVIKPGGYLFLTFPSFNTIRKLKAKYGAYKNISGHPADYPDFYQFALDPHYVSNAFENLGFALVEIRGLSSLDGLAEETRFGEAVKRILKIFPARLVTALSVAMDAIIGRQVGHGSLLVLRSNKSCITRSFN